MNPIRKSCLLLLLIIPAASAVHAQTTANVTLNVVLNNTSSITINDAFQTTTLTYSTPAHFQNGVTVNQVGALTTSSNQPYSVTLYASSNLQNGNSTIPAADVTVTPGLTTSNPNITLTPVPIPVGTTNAVQIINSGVGTASQNYNLSYSTEDAPTADFINKPSGTYTTTLTYTLTNP